MNSKKSTLLSLGLDDEDDATDFARRLLLLPSSGELLAYGGDDGVVTLLTTADNDNDNSNNSSKVIQRYDEGVRAMAVSHDGKRLAVGLEDGTTTIYSFSDYDGVSSHPFCANAHASSSDSNNKKEDDEDEDLLMSQELSLPAPEHSMAGPSFSGPVRDLAFHPSSYLLAIATEDAASCLVDATSSDTIMSNVKLQQEIAQHHDKCGIRGVSFSKDGTLLATLAMDGRLCVWQQDQQQQWTLLERETTTCVPKKDLGEHLGSDPADRSCRPLILLGNTENAASVLTPGQVQVLLRRVSVVNGARKMDSVPPSSDDGHVESTVALTGYSTSSAANDDQDETTTFVISSGRDGKVICWKLVEEGLSLVDILYDPTTKDASVPTDLVIHQGQLYAAMANGKYAVLTLPSFSTKKTDQTQSTETASSKTNTKADAWDTDDDEDFGGASEGNKKDDSAASTSASTSKTNKVRFVDDEAAEGDDEDDDTDDGLGGAGAKQNDITDDDRMMEEPMVDDAEDAPFEESSSFLSSSYHRRMVKTVPPQAAFAPSSTPLDLERRFLCWNHVGAVTLQRGDSDDRNTIDISFTDSAFRRPISFTDNQNFILASLGDEGGIFASDLQSDEDDQDDALQQELDGLDVSERTKALVKASQKKRMKKDFHNPTGSSIFFYKFDTFGSLRDKDWYLTLPDGERVMGAACGEGWAAVATSRRFLRMFTTGGNQGQVAWLKGEPVTMAGRGRFMGVVYHEGEPSADGTQNLGYSLYDTATFTVVSQGPVSCISKGSSLSWIGFSNDFSLLAMDSDGMVSMLAASSENSWNWTPMLDTVGMKKSADDQFWPVTVYDGKLVCVPLKGGNTYPDASRRPVTTTLSMRLPLARSAVPKNSVLEELSVRSNMALAQKKTVNDITDEVSEDVEQEYLTLSAQVDKVTLKLFAATVEAGKLERALDLVDRLHLEKSYDIAITLANRHDKLADLIEDAKERRFAVDDDMQDDFEDDGGYDEEESPVSHQTSAPSSFKQISPDMNQNGKRSLSLGNLAAQRRMKL